MKFPSIFESKLEWVYLALLIFILISIIPATLNVFSQNPNKPAHVDDCAILQNSGTSQGWKTFVDDKKRFSIEYPEHWIDSGREFLSGGNGNLPPFEKMCANRDNTGKLIDTPSDVVVVVLQYWKGTAENLVQFSLENNVNTEADPSRKLVEPIECGKYLVSGYNACSYVFAADNNQVEASGRAGILEVTTVDKSGNGYQISYTTDPENFDKEKPIMDHMIKSLKIFDVYSGNKTTGSDRFY